MNNKINANYSENIENRVAAHDCELRNDENQCKYNANPKNFWKIQCESQTKTLKWSGTLKNNVFYNKKHTHTTECMTCSLDLSLTLK